MPVVPKESLPKRSFTNAKETFKKLRADRLYVYAVFVLLAIEIISLVLRNQNDYVYYWYPLLAQIELLVIVFTTYLKSDAMRFCQRRKIAFLLLSVYFAFGATAIIIQLQNQFYIDIATGLLLGGAFISVVLSVFQNKKS
tara:strand:+ start:7349 stop:7768 length:420 start_codon:yes stop_codon:yes gene_type:complete